MAGRNPQMRLMNEARRKIDFDIEEITNVLDDGPDKTKMRRDIVQKVQNDPITGDLDTSYMTDKEHYLNRLRKTLHLRKAGIDIIGGGSALRTVFIAMGNELTFIAHGGPFLSTVMNLGSPEQVEKWVPLALNYGIIGTHAQTELGHGTNIRGLETTATFCQETQEFIINTPKLTSMKWWPGDLATIANHVNVMADLIIGGQSYGMHMFIVQIRDLDTHMPMTGVKVGDIGKTLEFEINDNGFLILDNVRIPRENMLAGVDEVDPQGNYSMKSDPRILYGGMMLVRVQLLDSHAIIPLQIAVTIATRYSTVRAQGSIEPDGPEVPVMDYVTQQHKILPYLASAYAYHFAARHILRYYFSIMPKIKDGDFSDLPELHALTAGMKAYITTNCLAGTESCRRACGGHGYLQASGFSRIVLSQMASLMFEGDNIVMYLQCARHLRKCTAASVKGETVKGFASYLNDNPGQSCPATNLAGISDIAVLNQCLRCRASYKLRGVHEKIEQLKKSGQPHHHAWNMASVELVEAAKTHLDVFVLFTFMEAIKETNVSAKSKQKLSDLCLLWSLHTINENIGDLLKSGYFTANQAQLAKDAELLSLSSVRKDALGLVDAFDFTDMTLRSCIGAYDGNAYERLYENALKSPRNKTKVDEGVYKILQPYLHEGRDILRGKKSKL